MNKKIFICFFSLIFIGTYAQDAKTLSENLSKLKKEGKLIGNEWFENPDANKKGLKITTLSVNKRGSHSNNSTMTSTSCNCWIPRDSTFQVVPFDGSGGAGGPGTPPNYANDDWSTSAITLPFNFCFYSIPSGTASNPLFINNNGNITFGNPFSYYSGTSFPCTAVSNNSPGACIAPFWEMYNLLIR